MGIGYLFFGFLFLLNPDLFTLDILPDVFGYLLIALGLKKLSFLEERLAISRRFFHYLAVLSALKLASVPSVLTTTMENTRLTVCFLFFVVETWLLFTAVDNGFKGIQYLAIRKDGNLALKGYETARFFLTVFVFVKTVCAFLPPSLAIFYPNIDADPEVVEVDRSGYVALRSFLFAVSAVVIVSFGIYTARILYAYIKRCRSDETFCRNVLADFEEKVSGNENVLTRLAVKSAFFWFLMSFFFLADLYLDDFSLIPSFLSPLCAWLGLRRLRPFLGKERFGFALPAAALVTLVSYAYRLVRLFLAAGDATAFGVGFVKDPGALVLGILNTLSLIVTLFTVIDRVAAVSARFTGYSYRVYRITLLICAVLLAVLGFFQFRYPSTYAVLPSVQWCVWVIGLYLHHKSMDEIRGEVDYKLM
ncbi:MAG: hypothetical protein IKC69_05135 [Clostridia bacterium]|nr:hypothetical protein [Clostridia bacterium]